VNGRIHEVKLSELIMLDLEHGIAAYESSDFTKAFETLIPLAQAGESQAQKIIAHMYSFGQGVEVSFVEAIKWYRLAAEQGDAAAQNNLASHLIEENPEEAIEWYITSAKQHFPFAEEMLGDIYSGELNISIDKIRNDLEAVKWYERAAKRGSLVACHRLGYIYSNNKSIIDEEKAVEWYQKSAEKDYAPSQLILSEAYREGSLGLNQDPMQSDYWLERSKNCV
jgi:uncharacterized protein